MPQRTSNPGYAAPASLKVSHTRRPAATVPHPHAPLRKDCSMSDSNHPRPATDWRLRPQARRPHGQRTFRRRMGAQRTLPTGPQPRHRGQLDHQRQHRTAPRTPRPGQGQRPDGNRTQRSDHPPGLLCRVAKSNVRHHCSEGGLHSLKQIRASIVAGSLVRLTVPMVFKEFTDFALKRPQNLSGSIGR